MNIATACLWLTGNDDIPAFLYQLPEYNKNLVDCPREGNSKITGFIDELLERNEVKLRQFSRHATSAN